MSRYASNTQVPQDRSEAEIKRLVLRYGADEYIAGQAAGQAIVVFHINNRRVRFELPFPKADEAQRTPSGRMRRGDAAVMAYEQEIRRRWRSLALVIKAKLEAVATGVTTFEQEFLAHIVMPDGKTVGQHVAPSIEAAYAGGKVRALLPEFAS